jgi:hypothetical protein
MIYEFFSPPVAACVGAETGPSPGYTARHDTGQYCQNVVSCALQIANTTLGRIIEHGSVEARRIRWFEMTAPQLAVTAGQKRRVARVGVLGGEFRDLSKDLGNKAVLKFLRRTLVCQKRKFELLAQEAENTRCGFTLVKSGAGNWEYIFLRTLK